MPSFSWRSAPSHAPATSEPRRKSQSTRAFIACLPSIWMYSIGWGIVNPLRALFLRSPVVGLTYPQIGWLGFIRSAMTCVAPPLLGMLSDRTGRRKPWILWGFVLSSVVTLLFPFARTFGGLFGLTAGDALTQAFYYLNLNALVLGALRESTRGRQFGLYRSVGSFGYGLVNVLLLGFLSRDKTYHTAFAAASIVYMVCAIWGFFGLRDQSTRVSHSPGWKEWGSIFRHRNLVVFYACIAFSSIGGSIGWMLFFNHLDETYHLPVSWIGLLNGVQALAEIPTLILLGSASDRVGRRPVLLLTFLASGLRWLLVGFAQDIPWLVVAQVLWGLGFAQFTVGVAFISDSVAPTQRASALGLLMLSYSVGNVLGPPIGGYLAVHVGLTGVFQLIGLFGLASAVAFQLGYRKAVTPTPGAFTGPG